MLQTRGQNTEDENKSREFLQHLGIDRNNLRQMLQLDEMIRPISEQQYTWNDIYGKMPVLDIYQYMKDKTNSIKTVLEEKQEDILQKVDEFLVPELKRAGMLPDIEKLHDLYSILQQEKEHDYNYLVTMSKNTYDVLQEEDSLARKELRGFMGHREERVADLLSSVDVFVQQMYEIYRYKAIEAIYQQILDKLENTNE